MRLILVSSAAAEEVMLSSPPDSLDGMTNSSPASPIEAGGASAICLIATTLVPVNRLDVSRVARKPRRIISAAPEPGGALPDAAMLAMRSASMV